MPRNFAVERKRVRAEYEALIDECRAAMDKSWEKKRARYMPKTDDPFEDIRMSGIRFDALFEEVTRRNQRIEKLRHEMDCRLSKLSESGDALKLTADLAEYRAAGDVVVVDVEKEAREFRRGKQPMSPVSPLNAEARRRFLSPDESPREPQLLTPPTSPVTTTTTAALPVLTFTPAEPMPAGNKGPGELVTHRPLHKFKFLSVLQLVIKHRKTTIKEEPA